MRECDNSKIHISSNFLFFMTSNHVGHLITITIITLQHFTKLHFTTQIQIHSTSYHLHFTTLPFGLTHLHFLSFYSLEI